MNLNISQKLIGGFMAVSLLFALAGIIGVINVNKVGKAGDVILDEEVPVADAAMEMMIATVKARDLLGEYMLETDIDKLDDIVSEYNKSIEEFEFFAGGILEGVDKNGFKIVATDNAEIRETVKETLEINEKFRQAGEGIIKSHRRALQSQTITLSDAEKQARMYMKAADEHSNNADMAMDKVEKLAGEEMTLAMARSDKAQSNAKLMLSIVTVFAVLVGVIIGIVISRGITNSLGKLLAMIKDISEGEGDLTKRLEVNSKDEIGEVAKWFNVFMNKLHEIIYQVANSTVQIASATQELASTAEEMASGAEEQTSQTSQVATSMEEMSATVQQVAKNSVSAAGKAKGAGETAVKGSEVVNQTVTGMDKIAGSVKDLQTVVKSLTNNSEKIGDVVNVIDDVADQTNLLALNAAIEAARAGEQGRGFAVVADEVRKLAERTTSSTKEIAAMVKSIQEDTSKAAVSMDVSAKEVDDGVKLANQAGASLTEIIGGSKVVQEMVQQIATAAEQQSAAAEEISSNIESIASVSKQNAAASQQTSMASQEISKLTDDLQVLVGKFKLSKAIEKHEVKKAADLSASKFEIINGKGVHKTDVPMKRSKKETFDNTASAEK